MDSGYVTRSQATNSETGPVNDKTPEVASANASHGSGGEVGGGGGVTTVTTCIIRILVSAKIVPEFRSCVKVEMAVLGFPS